MTAFQNSPTITDLSHELLCQIFQYLPLKEALSISMLCKKLRDGINMHLRLCKSIDFCEGKIYSYMSSSITDDHMHSLLRKCCHLEAIYGLHPHKVERRRLRKRSTLTVPGIIEALSLCSNLKAVETSDLRLLEAILQHLPQLEIIGHFRNRDGIFPPHASQRLKLQPYSRVSSLHLIGVEVPELTVMPHLQHLHLQCVRFTKLQPFRAFLAQNLQSFVMKHCMGPSMSLRYLSLVIALSSSPMLQRLELIRVPLPGGLFQRAVEDSYRHSGFVNLKTLVIAGCKGVLEADLGHLMIVASKSLETLFIQPSLTRDSLFVSLQFAHCEFPNLKNLHLGYMDKFNTAGEWSNDILLNLGLAEVPDTPASLTDMGLKVISELFPDIESLAVSNCPHLIAMDQWYPGEGGQAWRFLTDLTLQKCHCLQLSSFEIFLKRLCKIEVVILEDMFREPPKGCSHVGLSAGTGLGMSSAVVSNQDEHIAVQGHQQDFEAQPDDQMDEEMDDEVEGEIWEPHVMVSQEDFYDAHNSFFHPTPPRDISNSDNIPHEGSQELENATGPNRNLNVEVKQEANDSPESSTSVVNSNPQNIKKELTDNNIISDNEQSNAIKEHDVPKRKTQKRKSRNQEEPNKSLDEAETQFSHSSAADDSENVIAAKRSRGMPQASDTENLVKQSDENVSKQSKNSVNNCCDPHDASKEASTSKDERFCSHNENNFEGSPNVSACTSQNNYVKKETNISKIVKKRGKKRKNSTEVLGAKSLDSVHNVVSEYKGPLTRQRGKLLTCNVCREISCKRHKNCIKFVQPFPIASTSKSTYDCACGNHKGNLHSCTNSSNSVKCGNRQPDVPDASTSHKGKAISGGSGKYTRKDSKLETSRSSQRLSNKSQKTATVFEDVSTVSQGTQATSADIRRSFKRQNQGYQKRRHYHRSRRSSVHCSKISEKQRHKRQKQTKYKQEFQNKATSTSDPLLEDDVVQTLKLESETLISISIISCGISDICVEHCHSLTHIEVQALRILKKIKMNFCPALKRLNISQCPKLLVQDLIPEVLSLLTLNSFLVSYEPCLQDYHLSEIERIVFSNATLEQSVILFHDFIGTSQETIQASFMENLMRWMEFIQKMWNTLVFQRSKQSVKKLVPVGLLPKATFPWGHDIRKIYGHYDSPHFLNGPSDWQYQIVTNNYLFTSALELSDWSKGFPGPEECRHYNNVSELSYDEVKKSLQMHRRIIGFYIPVMEKV